MLRRNGICVIFICSCSLAAYKRTGSNAANPSAYVKTLPWWVCERRFVTGFLKRGAFFLYRQASILDPNHLQMTLHEVFTPCIRLLTLIGSLTFLTVSNREMWFMMHISP